MRRVKDRYTRMASEPAQVLLLEEKELFEMK